MTGRNEKLIIGQRLRVLRQSLGLTQAQMAAELGVSASYVTLIEADQRPASARFLMKLAEVYDLNVSELAPSTDAQLATDFSAALKEPALGTGSLSRSEIEAVLQASPRIASAFVRLHEQYREAILRPQADDNPLTDRDKAEVLAENSRPVDAVRNWFYAHRNYVDALDRPAEDLADLYHLRWQAETGIGDLKGQRGSPEHVLRSKKPATAIQELYAMFCVYQAVRDLIDYASPPGLDPSRVSFTKAIDAARDTVTRAALSPPAPNGAPSPTSPPP